MASLPADFKITNSYNSTEFTVANATSGTGTSTDPYVWKLSDVPVGTEVTFTESGYTVANYALTINGTASTVADANKSTKITVAKTGNAATEFNNVYTSTTPSTGSIKLTKTIEGPITDTDKAGLTFTITDADGNPVTDVNGNDVGPYVLGTDFTPTATGYEKTIDNLEQGSYKVTETLYDKDESLIASVSYKIGDATTYTDGDNATVTVENGETTNLAFKDTYEKKVGSLVITKSMTGDGYDEDKTFEITVTFGEAIKYSVGTGSPISTASSTYVANLKAGASVTLNNIPVGTSYTVEETALSAADQTAGYGTDGITYSNTATIKKIEAETTGTTGKTDTVSVNNTYSAPVTPKAKLTVKKVETGDVDGSGKPSSYSFYVKSGSDYVQDATSGTLASTKPATPFTVAVSNTDTDGVVISGLELGKTYIVEEVAVNDEDLNPGFSCRASYSPDRFEATADKTEETITITNTYTYTAPEPKKASLTINKTVAKEGENAALIVVPETKTFSIAVKHGNNYIQNTEGTEAASEKYFEVTPGTSLVIDNLLVGETYEIIEDETKAKEDVTPVGTGLEKTGPSSVKIDKESANNVANIKNTYTNPAVPTYTVKVSKQVAGAGTELPDAELCIKKYDGDVEGEVVDEWTSDGTQHEATLPAGKYVLIEKAAPSGYDIASKIIFTVDNEGNVTGTTASTNGSISGNLIVMLDAVSTLETNVKISKVDISNHESIIGATLRLIKTSVTPEETVLEWKSTTSVKEIPVTEGSYKIIEVEAPDGYKKTDFFVTFDVKKDGNSLKVENVKGNPGEYDATTGLISFRNDPIKVKISKVDATSSEEVPGATIVLKNSAGTKVDEWTSTKTAHEISGLEAGTYTLEETVAPEGYKKETTKITFTVDEYGNVKDVKGPGELGADGVLKFKNSPIKGTLYVHVTVETPNDTEGIETKDVPGAEVTVTDETGKEIGKYITNEKGEVVDEKTGKYPEVTPGKYTVTITKIPDNYEFKEKLQGKTSKVEVPAGGQGKHEAVIETLLGGLDILITEEPSGRVVPHAKVTVTMPDGTKVECETDDNGMITQFAKKDQFGNYTSPLGEYTYVVTWVPDGYTVTLNKENKGTVTAGNLTSLESKIATKSESKTDKTTTNTKTTTSKKTGDTTPIALVVILMGLSLAAATAIVIKRRKNRA